MQGVNMSESGLIGKDLGTHQVPVSLFQVLFYAKVSGQTDRLFFDEAYAKVQGYPSVVIAVGLLFGLEMQKENPYAWFDEVGLYAGKTLHASQVFTCHAQCFAGDVLTFASRVVDIYTKKNGTLYFLDRHTRVKKQDRKTVYLYGMGSLSVVLHWPFLPVLPAIIIPCILIVIMCKQPGLMMFLCVACLCLLSCNDVLSVLCNSRIWKISRCVL